MMLGLALQTYGQALAEEQEVLMYVADILIDVYAADSAVLRADAAATANLSRRSTQSSQNSQSQLFSADSAVSALNAERRAALHVDAARVFVSDAALRIEVSARQALAAMTEGDALRTTLAALRRVLKVTPINAVALRRRLADEAVARGGYVF